MDELYHFDTCYRKTCGRIAGMDEAGRGPLAGPLVTAAVVLPAGFSDPLLNDSKKLSDSKRRTLFPRILEASEATGIGIVTPSEIDSMGMSRAVRKSFRMAMEKVAVHADVFLVDGISVSGLSYPCRFLVKGDSRSLSIAAASIVAKVTRDDMMLEESDRYPEYGFEKNKGYGTPEHLRILNEMGPCPIHRMSFEPLASRFPTGQMELFPVSREMPGKTGEDRAAAFLEASGYSIIDRNVKLPSGEIDIVAGKDGCVAFAEVKSSMTGDKASLIRRIDAKKVHRLRRAAAEWIALMEHRGDVELLGIFVLGSDISLTSIK